MKRSIQIILIMLLTVTLFACGDASDTSEDIVSVTTAAETYKYTPPKTQTIDPTVQTENNQGEDTMTKSYTIESHVAGGITIPTYTIPEANDDMTSKKNTDVTFPAHNRGEDNTNSQFIGANHIWPAYSRSGKDTFTDGGLTTLELGASAIKTYVSHMYDNYYASDIWPEERITTNVDMVSHEYYQSLFSMDIDTYVLGAYIFTSEFGNPAVYFSSQFPEAARKMEYEQLYELTYYLCKKYEGTGKTFIIQNWESDWACVPASDNRQYPTEEILDRFIRWTNTRQDAVMAAREAAGCSDVYVYHAIEVNRNIDGMNGNPCVLYDAVPYTYCDFYAYSCYDTQENDETFAASLDTMLKIVSENRAGGASRCYIGEFGWPHELGSQMREDIAERVLRIAREKGFSHAFWWEMYGSMESEYTYWLISDQNEYSEAWNALYKFVNGTDSEAYLACVEAKKVNFPLTYALSTDGAEQKHGLFFVNIKFDGDAAIGDYADRKCLALPETEGQDYIYFIADPVLTPEMNKINITLTYFDEAAGQLLIQYNDKNGNVAASKSIKTEGSGSWQTVTFKLKDAGFNDLFHGGYADFRFMYQADAPLRIADVTIEPAEQ